MASGLNVSVRGPSAATERDTPSQTPTHRRARSPVEVRREEVGGLVEQQRIHTCDSNRTVACAAAAREATLEIFPEAISAP